MSDYEAEARYEHATTILNWNSASAEPPVLTPPSDDDGWMLFSQNPAKAVEVYEDGVPVTRFLCVWRRRLTRVEAKKPTRSESMAAWKAKKDEEKKILDEEAAERQRAWKERMRLQAIEDESARQKKIRDAWLLSPRLWELIKDMSGVRALACYVDRYHTKWKVFFFPSIGAAVRDSTMKQVNLVTKGIRNDVLVARVDMEYVRGLIFMASNDAALPVSARVDAPGYTESFQISAVADLSFGAKKGEVFTFSGSYGQAPTTSVGSRLSDGDEEGVRNVF